MSAEIVLSVGREVRRSPLPGHTSLRDAAGGGGRPGDKEIAALRRRVIEQPRLGRRCWYCHVSFGQTEMFEVHHLDGDHGNDGQDNVVLICLLCHIPWHLDLVIQTWAHDPGRIIYLPEVSQQELNAMLYAVFFHSEATIDRSPENKRVEESERVAAAVYERLAARDVDVEQVHGQVERPGLSKVHAMVRTLQSLDAAEYARRESLFDGCRYLPPWSPMLALAPSFALNGAMFNRLQIDSWPAIACQHGAH
ncbi:MAG: HNH endonuclease [Luteimonas sp.]